MSGADKWYRMPLPDVIKQDDDLVVEFKADGPAPFALGDMIVVPEGAAVRLPEGYTQVVMSSEPTGPSVMSLGLIKLKLEGVSLNRKEIRYVQKQLGVVQDGIWGMATQAAALKCLEAERRRQKEAYQTVREVEREQEPATEGDPPKRAFRFDDDE